MKVNLKIFSIFALFVVSVSCSNEETYINMEETIISGFYNKAITSTDPKIIDSIYKDGVFKLVINKGDINNHVEKGDSVLFYYVASSLTSGGFGNIFATNIDSIAEKINLTGFIGRGVEKGIAGKNKYFKGLEKGLLMMNEYEHSLVFFKSDQAYGDIKLGSAPAQTPIIFEILITKIKKN